MGKAKFSRRPSTEHGGSSWQIPAIAAVGDSNVSPPSAPQADHLQRTNTRLAFSLGCAAGCLGWFLLNAILMGALVPTIGRAGEGAKRLACQTNLKALSISLQMYAMEHDGIWPALSPGTTLLQPDWPSLCDDVENLDAVLTCPSSDDPIPGGTYYYLGYAITNEREAEAFAAAVRVRATEGGGFDDDLPVPASHGTGTIRRLRKLVESPPDAPRPDQIPVLLEKATYHAPEGMNVLFLDGHVEFIHLDDKFPVTSKMLALLDDLERSASPAPEAQ